MDADFVPRLHVATHTRTACGSRAGEGEGSGWDIEAVVCVCGSSGVEGRLTGLTDTNAAEERGGQREERGEGWRLGRRDRETVVRALTHTEQCTLVYCVCLSQWQPVYHVAINLPTITLWCPGWRPQTGVSLTPAHFVSCHCLRPPLLMLPGPLLFAQNSLVQGWHVVFSHQEIDFRITLRH